jgi:hypothetical protein
MEMDGTVSKISFQKTALPLLQLILGLQCGNPLEHFF